MFKNFFQTLADNICGYNINKVLEIADIYAQAIDVSVSINNCCYMEHDMLSYQYLKNMQLLVRLYI